MTMDEECDFCGRPAIYQRFQKAYDQSQPGLYDRYLYCEECGWVGLELIHPQEGLADDRSDQEGTSQDPQD